MCRVSVSSGGGCAGCGVHRRWHVLTPPRDANSLQVIAGTEPKERISDVLGLLANGSPQAQYITRIMTKWAEQNGLQV